jgi:hypothetical protein
MSRKRQLNFDWQSSKKILRLDELVIGLCDLFNQLICSLKKIQYITEKYYLPRQHRLEIQSQPKSQFFDNWEKFQQRSERVGPRRQLDRT